MDEVQFAQVTAQVVPVVLLALVVETRSLHDHWLARLADSRGHRGASHSGQGATATVGLTGRHVLASLIGNYVLFASLILLEVAALLVALGQAESETLASRVVTSPGTYVFLGSALMLVVVQHSLGVAQTYHRAGVVTEAQRQALHRVARVLFLAVFVIASLMAV